MDKKIEQPTSHNDDKNPILISDPLTPEPPEIDGVRVYKCPKGGWIIVDDTTGLVYFVDTLEEKLGRFKAILEQRANTPHQLPTLDQIKEKMNANTQSPATKTTKHKP